MVGDQVVRLMPLVMWGRGIGRALGCSAAAIGVRHADLKTAEERWWGWEHHFSILEN